MSKAQTEAATWARKLPRLRRNAEELREEGWEIREPPNVETPPSRRIPRRYGPTGHPIDPCECKNALDERCGPEDCVLDHAWGGVL